jgi:hypothetical protein
VAIVTPPVLLLLLIRMLLVIKLFGNCTVVREEVGFTNGDKTVSSIRGSCDEVFSSWFLPGWHTQRDRQLATW